MLVALASPPTPARTVASRWIAPALGAPPTPASVPGPELPAIPPRHPALPSPVPGLAELERLAAIAPAGHRFTPGAHPSTIRNAHYSNTRAQLAYAIAGPYNSVEGDVRLRNGMPVMQHDGAAGHDLTFEQWALLASRAGKHLRIDVKEPAALGQVASTLERLGIRPDTCTFNVGLATPWSTGLTPGAVRALRDRFEGAWVTINLPVPLGPGYVLAARAARQIGGERLGVAIMAGTVHRGDIDLLRRSFAVVNAWNLPLLGEPDVDAMTARLRAMGVNGMIDLRRRDDPLADD